MTMISVIFSRVSKPCCKVNRFDFNNEISVHKFIKSCLVHKFLKFCAIHKFMKSCLVHKFITFCAFHKFMKSGPVALVKFCSVYEVLFIFITLLFEITSIKQYVTKIDFTGTKHAQTKFS